MPRRVDDARRWRFRADEARYLADQLADPASKRLTLGVAASYIVLAQKAGERDASRRRD